MAEKINRIIPFTPSETILNNRIVNEHGKSLTFEELLQKLSEKNDDVTFLDVTKMAEINTACVEVSSDDNIDAASITLAIHQVLAEEFSRDQRSEWNPLYRNVYRAWRKIRRKSTNFMSSLSNLYE